MSGVRFTGVITPVLCTTSTKTLIQLLAPANQRVIVDLIEISFKGVVATDAPIEVQLVEQSTAGTSAALTLLKENKADNETLQTTALQTITVEPTTGDVIRSFYVHPQFGRPFNLGRGINIVGGSRLGVRVIAPGVSVLTCLTIGGHE